MSLPVVVAGQPDDFHPQPFPVTRSMVRRQSAAQLQIWERELENWTAYQMAADDLATNSELVQTDQDIMIRLYDKYLPGAVSSKFKQQILAERADRLDRLNLNVVLRYAR